MNEPTSFCIIGGASFRAQYYLRVASALPDRFRVTGLLVRKPDVAEEMARRWRVPVVTSLDELISEDRPEFAVVSVRRHDAAELIVRLSRMGMPVLTETPPAADEAGLRAVFDAVGHEGRVQVAEQYQFHPLNQARLTAIDEGMLGKVTQATVSISHGYHGVSLLRRILGVEFAPARIRAMRFGSPMIEGPTRLGPPTAEQISEVGRELAWLDFGRALGIYDFTVNQHRSWIRSNHLSVRGVRGEIFDRRLSTMHDTGTPLPLEFVRVNRGEYENQEGYFLQGITLGQRWIFENQFAPARLYDDEIAVAECLQRMARYVAGGSEFYSLGDACHDTYLALLIEEAIRSGRTIESDRLAWAESA